MFETTNQKLYVICPSIKQQTYLFNALPRANKNPAKYEYLLNIICCSCERMKVTGEIIVGEIEKKTDLESHLAVF
jgi:hypothetical protein